MQKTDGRGGLRSGVRYYFFRYVASGMTSKTRWKFGANRLSFKGGTDKRTLQLYIIDGICGWPLTSYILVGLGSILDTYKYHDTLMVRYRFFAVIDTSRY